MLSAAQVQELVERMLKSSGRRIDISQPFVDAMLPTGWLHALLQVTRRLRRRHRTFAAEVIATKPALLADVRY